MAPTCLQALAGMLLEVCKNPTQPGFNHFLFESVAALVRFTAAAAGGAGGVERLEAQLFPAFQLVLQQDVQARTESAWLREARQSQSLSCVLEERLGPVQDPHGTANSAWSWQPCLRQSGRDAGWWFAGELLCSASLVILHILHLPRPARLQAPGRSSAHALHLSRLTRHRVKP